MSKSLIDILWEEVKRSFYIDTRRNSCSSDYTEEDIDYMWSKYQIELINKKNK